MITNQDKVMRNIIKQRGNEIEYHLELSIIFKTFILLGVMNTVLKQHSPKKLSKSVHFCKTIKIL